MPINFYMNRYRRDFMYSLSFTWRIPLLNRSGDTLDYNKEFILCYVHYIYDI